MIQSKKLNIINPLDYKFTWRTKFNLWWYTKKKSITYLIPYQIRDGWYKIKCFFKPHGKKYRAAIPNTWTDVSMLIKDVNFAFVKGFYEDEYLKGIVDWNSDEYNRKFAKWLESAYKYITIDRPALQKQMDAAYPETNFNDMFDEPKTDEHGRVTRTMKSCKELYGKSYEEIYSEVNRLEALIDKKDTKILTEIIKYRQYFWT